MGPPNKFRRVADDVNDVARDESPVRDTTDGVTKAFEKEAKNTSEAASNNRTTRQDFMVNGESRVPSFVQDSAILDESAVSKRLSVNGKAY